MTVVVIGEEGREGVGELAEMGRRARTDFILLCGIITTGQEIAGERLT